MPRPPGLPHACSLTCLSAGGPLCAGSFSIPLAPASQRQLAAVLQGEAASAQLLRTANATSEEGSPALYPLVWLLRGDLCVGAPLGEVHGSGAGGVAWASHWVACNASLLPPPSGAAGLGVLSLGAGGSGARQRALAASPGGGHGEAGSSAARWWQLACSVVNATGDPVPAQQEQEPPTAGCSAGYGGPRLVAVLERVQGGLLGQTLSRYGVAGLYTVVVLGVGG